MESEKVTTREEAWPLSLVFLNPFSRVRRSEIRTRVSRGEYIRNFWLPWSQKFLMYSPLEIRTRVSRGEYIRNFWLHGSQQDVETNTRGGAST